MKSQFSIICSCGYQGNVETTGTKDPKDFVCPSCGAPFWFVPPLGNVVGTRIWGRASAELQNGDFTLAIVLSAIAVECELARLYVQWRHVDVLDTRTPTQTDSDEWSAQWNKWTGIALRFKKASELMVGKDLDSFLLLNPGPIAKLAAKYPDVAGCASPQKFFISGLFHKRNRVVHDGEIDFGQDVAEKCVTLAATLFEILEAMDKERLKALDAKHKAHLKKQP
ncbi:MAG: hypothetical protein WB729_05105 [Candidatus Sulfotelmatobacter sp.]